MRADATHASAVVVACAALLTAACASTKQDGTASAGMGSQPGGTGAESGSDGLGPPPRCESGEADYGYIRYSSGAMAIEGAKCCVGG
jgi:hypothetical protein